MIGTAEFYQRLVEAFTHAIRSRQEGVFQIDLRLRPTAGRGASPSRSTRSPPISGRTERRGPTSARPW